MSALQRSMFPNFAKKIDKFASLGVTTTTIAGTTRTSRPSARRRSADGDGRAARAATGRLQ